MCVDINGRGNDKLELNCMVTVDMDAQLIGCMWRWYEKSVRFSLTCKRDVRLGWDGFAWLHLYSWWRCSFSRRLSAHHQSVNVRCCEQGVQHNNNNNVTAQRCTDGVPSRPVSCLFLRKLFYSLSLSPFFLPPFLFPSFVHVCVYYFEIIRSEIYRLGRKRSESERGDTNKRRHFRDMPNGLGPSIIWETQLSSAPLSLSLCITPGSGMDMSLFFSHLFSSSLLSERILFM